jgi:hypothetical protein
MEKFNLKKAILENKATFLSSLVEGEKEYYKDAEADDAEHIDALEKDMKDDKKSSKMKMSELKAKIKEMALAEMNVNEDTFAPTSEEDFLNEVEAILAEADEVAVDDTEVAVDGEENIDVDTTVEVDPNVKAVQDALTQAQAAAQKLGDSKLTDQIGNTITFFTRAHVVEKGAVAEDLNENTSLSPVNLTKQNFDKIENSPLSKEYEGMFSILDNLISKYPEFKKKDIYDYFKLLAIDKYFNSGYLDRMWRKNAVAEGEEMEEGYYGANTEVEDLAYALDYEGYDAFFQDNPGAVTAVLDWAVGVPEFRAKMEDGGLLEAKKEDLNESMFPMLKRILK